MIDLHCHLLPGIDDGPGNLEGAIDLARAQRAAGVDTVVCTPHVVHGYPANTSAAISDHVETLRGALAHASVDLDIVPGGEVALARALELDDDELRALHLGGSGYLLLEPPLSTSVPRLTALVQSLQARGHGILIAHPERCAAFHHEPLILTELVRGGALAQVTATSLTGEFGRTVARLARDMMDAGLVHVIASDAHDARRRRPGLADPLERTGFGWLTEWACTQVPAAILSGDPIPVRPQPPAPTRRGFLRRR